MWWYHRSSSPTGPLPKNNKNQYLSPSSISKRCSKTSATPSTKTPSSISSTASSSARRAVVCGATRRRCSTPSPSPSRRRSMPWSRRPTSIDSFSSPKGSTGISEPCLSYFPRERRRRESESEKGQIFKKRSNLEKERRKKILKKS